jgi:hypothetical protein
VMYKQTATSRPASQACYSRNPDTAGNDNSGHDLSLDGQQIHPSKSRSVP